MINTNNCCILIGIDTGTHTGIALYDLSARAFGYIETVKIHEAMRMVGDAYEKYGKSLMVLFEDARLRKWYAGAGREKLQGAGSIKRDCNIWDDYLNDLGVNYVAVPPKHNITKLNETQFRAITGWTLRTSEHARDAAMLVFGFK